MDPDVLVKVCVTLMITTLNEVQTGVTTLWKQWPSFRFRDYPNFAKYIPKNYWADHSYLYMSRNNMPWEIIQPFVKEYNKLREKLTDAFYIVLNESMSGWRSKTTKTGGLPNITVEPRKPVNLGTQASWYTMKLSVAPLSKEQKVR